MKTFIQYIEATGDMSLPQTPAEYEIEQLEKTINTIKDPELKRKLTKIKIKRQEIQKLFEKIYAKAKEEKEEKEKNKKVSESSDLTPEQKEEKKRLEYQYALAIKEMEKMWADIKEKLKNKY